MIPARHSQSPTPAPWPLPYFVAAVALSVGGELLPSLANYSHPQNPTRIVFDRALLTACVLGYVLLAGRLAIRAENVGVLLAAMVMGSAFYTSALVLLAVQLLTPIPIYQIDTDLGRFVYGLWMETTLQSWFVAALAALVAMVALYSARLVRRVRERR